MAYMTRDNKGPYPSKAGEYCGNHHPDSHPSRQLGHSPEQAAHHQREWLATMRFGRPRGCEAGTSEEMAAQGWVGLYLKADRKLFDWETEVPTPDCLKEHAAPADEVTP